MLFQLPSGKTIEIPAIMMIDLTDDEFDLEIQDLMADDHGENIDDAFYNSSLDDGKQKENPIEDSLNDYIFNEN